MIKRYRPSIQRWCLSYERRLRPLRARSGALAVAVIIVAAGALAASGCVVTGEPADSRELAGEAPLAAPGAGRAAGVPVPPSVQVSDVDSDGDGILDSADADDDNDGIPDLHEHTDQDGDGVPDRLDLDSDDDGIPDVVEAGHSIINPDRDPDGRGDSDRDGMLDGPVGLNGLADAVESAPDSGVLAAPLLNTDDDSLPDFRDLDSDDDGLFDIDETHTIFDLDQDDDGTVDGQGDADLDGLQVAIDGDDDVFGYPDVDVYHHDDDEDGIPDPYDPDNGAPGDSDDDGFSDAEECPAPSLVPCPDQQDCEASSGWPCPNTTGEGPPDYMSIDGDDSDGDGVIDDVDVDPIDPYLCRDVDGDGCDDCTYTGPDGSRGDPLDDGDDGDGDSICDLGDLDADNDGVPDRRENHLLLDPLADRDEDGVPNYLDADDRGDQRSNLCPDEDADGTCEGVGALFDPDGDQTPSHLDLDADGDGIPDCEEAGHGVADLDRDGRIEGRAGANGLIDAVETAPGTGLLRYSPADTDRDDLADLLDRDSDADHIPDAVEARAESRRGRDDLLGFVTPADTDGDGVPDYRDFDSDGDHVSDRDEAGSPSLAPIDTDRDGTPDFRDLDSDADHIPDRYEGRDWRVLAIPVDTDNDGVPDFRDLDSDQDGLHDTREAGGSFESPVDSDRDGVPDFRAPYVEPPGLHDRLGVKGGRGCSATSRGEDDAGATAAVAALVWLLIIATRRRRSRRTDGPAPARSPRCRRAAALALTSRPAAHPMGTSASTRGRRAAALALMLGAAFVAAPATTRAQARAAETDYAIERFRLAGDRHGVLDVEWAAVGPHLTADVALWVGYSDDPLNLYFRDDAAETRVGSLVSRRLGGALVTSLALWGRLQLGFELGLVVEQAQDTALLMEEFPPLTRFGVGDLRLAPKLALFRQSAHGLDLALVGGLTLPVGAGRDYIGNTGVLVAPELVVSRRFGDRIRAALNLGYRARRARRTYDLLVDDELFAHAGVGYRARPALELAATLAVATNADAGELLGDHSHAEVMAGLSYAFRRFALFSAAGTALLEGYGSPDWRLLAGVRLTPEPATRR